MKKIILCIIFFSNNVYAGQLGVGQQYTTQSLQVISNCTVTIASSVTGTTGLTTLMTCTIPKGVMGNTGTLYSDSTWTWTNNANSKTMYINFGGINFYEAVRTTSVSGWILKCIENETSNTQKVCGNETLTSYGIAGTLPLTGTVNTNQDVSLKFSCLLGVASDICSIVRARIWIIK